ncbi:NUDIX hydrolase [Microbacterium pumilum]|uniref:Nudix hydrolase domain-containing protein n=1 Tax=Microbacterium pumilum TaxID=344165 RepID=A0ABN2SGA0_9MICO
MPDTPSSTEQALQAIADAVGDGRQRVESDLSDPAIPVAATVVLLRNGGDGLEVLMIERPDRGSFAGAWVFPGGKLEPGDREPPADASSAGSATEEADARRAAVRETFEETGLELAASALVTVSCWDPPPGLPLRIRTWFFVVAAPPAEELRLQPGEAVASEWLRPADALQRHAQGEFTLYPPTWVTLYGLNDATDVEAVLATTRLAATRSFETQVRRGPSGPVFYWREDAEYEGDRPDAASGPRHRLEVGASPWVYTYRQ